MQRTRSWILVVGLATNVVAAQQSAPRPLIVHEWGTITTHHTANGTPEGRLNRIGPSEILPPFVHQYEPAATQPQSPQPTQRAPLIKSPVTPGRPDVTMRLETPVMYFYPPSGSGAQPRFDVSVRFRGGILNEFYPNADATSQVDVDRITTKMQAGMIKAWDGDVLNNYVVGSLCWHDVSLNPSASLPSTSSHVWLAPRRVRSTAVVTLSDEAEQYLFYRGVAHLDALVQTELAPTELRLRAPANLQWLSAPTMTIGALWLVDIRPNGGSAVRALEAIPIAKDSAARELRRVPLFTPRDYSSDAIAALRRSMKQALIARGLFEDEAEAMLSTWEESYFRAPGLRLLYIVPQEWISYHLPVTISTPHELTRVLVGRIDLARP
jgi:hypothetical protein